jgi:DNA polymerase-1
VATLGCARALESASFETRPILQIHDELLFDGPPAEIDEVSRTVRAEMTGAWELDPPLAVDLGVGANWPAVSSLRSCGRCAGLRWA